MYKNIFKTIVILSSLQTMAQEQSKDVSENFITDRDTASYSSNWK